MPNSFTYTVDSRNRFYDPSIGRFISQDPLGMVDGPNMYNFCGGDPVNRMDPMGTEWVFTKTNRFGAGYWNWSNVGDGETPTTPAPTLMDAIRQGILGNRQAMGEVALNDDEIKSILELNGYPYEHASTLKKYFYEKADNDPRLANLDIQTRYNIAARELNDQRARRLIVHNFSGAQIQNYTKNLYYFIRAANPIHFAAEKGYATGSGEEPVTGDQQGLIEGVSELVLYFAIMKGANWIGAKTATLKPLTGKAGTIVEREAAIATIKELNSYLEKAGYPTNKLIPVPRAMESVIYGSSDLSKAAIQYRLQNNITGGRNVAVFEYRAADGTLQTIARASERAWCRTRGKNYCEGTRIHGDKAEPGHKDL
ncbi:MAG: RHS repeat-associated core domain-containing protein [Planctomycetes bacterium]|nr:RHS repeat-associated core domain-containing protein [Planctomycetota bacterium]